MAQNEKLNEAIAAIGGPVHVAFHLGRTVAWVYKCKAIGGISATADAVRFQALAGQYGVAVSVTELVPNVAGNGHGPKGGGGRDSTRSCASASDTASAARSRKLGLAAASPSAEAA